MESFFDTDAKFDYFNRPWEDCKVEVGEFGVPRLPSAFTHWTYVASGG